MLFDRILITFAILPIIPPIFLAASSVFTRVLNQNNSKLNNTMRSRNLSVIFSSDVDEQWLMKSELEEVLNNHVDHLEYKITIKQISRSDDKTVNIELICHSNKEYSTLC